MNFLAHVYLSEDDSNIIVGNLIADSVRGKQINNYKGGILLGIHLHRRIDTFTDTHPIFHKSKDLIVKKYHHYSSVLIDMFYDHFLAKNWHEYSQIPLKQFARNAYQLLFDNYEILPVRSKRILPYMAGNDWLSNYANLEEMHKYLKGMAHRANFDSHMDKAILDLKLNYDAFENHFRNFFPEIIKFSHNQIEDIRQNCFTD